MKLEIRRAGTNELIMTDENGNVLPNQARIEIIQEPGELTIARVSFNMHDDNVSINLNGKVLEN